MLTKQEQEAINALRKQIEHFIPKNIEKITMYEAKNKVEDLGLTIPEKVKDLSVALGWPRLAVDAVAERIDFQGWKNEPFLKQVSEENFLEQTVATAVKDSMIFGKTFVSITSGGEGEPEVLIQPHSPFTCTINNNPRTKTPKEALIITSYEKDFTGRSKIKKAVYFTEIETIEVEYKVVKGENTLVETNRSKHNLGRVPVVEFVNNPDFNWKGSSEITPSLKNMVNSAMRTVLNSEVGQAFYTIPQRYIIGFEPPVGEDGRRNYFDAFSAMTSQMIALNKNPDGSNPTTGSYSTASPSDLLGYLPAWAKEFASESGLPQDYFGYSTGNPTSAEALQVAERRLIIKTKNKIRALNKPLTQMAALINLVAGLPVLTARPEPMFGPVSIPSIAQAADAITKYISQGVLLPESQLVDSFMGLTPEQGEQRRNEIIAARAAKESVQNLQLQLGLIQNNSTGE